MRRFLVFTIFLLFLTEFLLSQTFTYTADRKCAKVDYTFTPSGITTADSVVWDFGDGQTASINASPWEVVHKYVAADKYSVTMNVYSGGALTASETKTVYVYDLPNLTINYYAGGIVCAGQDQITIVIDTVNLESPDLTMNITWGDGSSALTATHDDLADSLKHLYTSTSCGKVIDLQGTIIKDKFLIVVSAQNQCTQGIPQVFFKAVNIKSKPDIDINIPDIDYSDDLNAYYSCDSENLKIENPSYGENNCLGVDNVLWNIYDFNNQIIAQCTDCEESFDLSVTTPGMYKIELQQSNVCGTSTVTANYMLREKPYTFFTINDNVNCYPAQVFFYNKSDPSVVLSQWQFTGDTTKAVEVPGVADTSYIYTEEGDYHVKLYTNDNYCWGFYDTTLVFDHRCMDLYVPNAFIPSSSDPNLKIFKPAAINLIKYRIDIYNMYGEHLWSSTEIEDGKPAEGWDGTYKGKDCPAGTYIWKIYAEIDEGDIFGTRVWDGQAYKTKKDGSSKRSRSGTFVLIR